MDDVQISDIEPQKSKKILKTVGIVVGIIVVLTIIGLVIYFITKKSSSSNAATTSSKAVLGASCSRSDDCDDGLTCSGGTCKTSCSSNTDCKISGQTCSGGVCVTGSSASCNNTVACPQGQICVGSTCVASTGCSSDSTCPSTTPKCRNGTCVQCIIDTDCKTNQVCNNSNNCVASTTTTTTPSMYRLLTTHGFNAETGLNVDLTTLQNKTLSECKLACTNESRCKGFTRPANLGDDTTGDCYLKSGPLLSDNKIFSNGPASTDNYAFNSWLKIDKYDNLIPATGSTANTYLKSTAQYIDNKYKIEDFQGTLSQCITRCNTDTKCRGFNRATESADSKSQVCTLMTTNVANILNNNATGATQYNSWVNISVPEQVVSGGNDGTCGCDKFCAQDWNGHFPNTWGGARCVGTVSSTGVFVGGCAPINGSCVCMRDDKIGFVQRSGTCKDASNNLSDRKTVTGSPVDTVSVNSAYDDNYYKKANNSTDRVLKITTNEPRSGQLDGPVDKSVLCNSWCGEQGFNFYNSGQNELQKVLNWDSNKRGNCLYAKSNRVGAELNTCNEAVNYGDSVSKKCVCLKKI